MSAVSRSRISPTMMMSGSCRSSVRTPVAKSTPMPGCTCIWLNERLDHLDRVLDRADVHLGRGESLQRRIERRRLAGAGRAGHQDDAVAARLIIFSQRARSSGVKPRSVKSRTSTSGVKIRMTIFSPKAVGIVEMRSSIFLAVRRDRLDAAVLRPALLDDLHAREQLDPRRHRNEHRRRDRVHLVQHAVDAKAHDADVAPRLDVDVGGALLERVLPQPVDDVDDVLVVGVEVSVLAQLDQLLEVARERERRPSTSPAPSSSTARG